MLQIKNLTIVHKKDLRTMVDQFTWSLNPGDKAAVIGVEGNGKSTLLKLIYNPQLVEDYIQYTGEIMRGRSRFGYLAQELEVCYDQLSLMAYFQDCPFFYDRSYNELVDIARQLKLPSDIFYMEQPVKSLSGGEKVKIQLARILIEQPDILLLDEPSNDIDLDTLQWLERFIRNCPLPILYVSHDETLLENTANVVIHFEQLRRKTMARATVAKTGYQTYVKERLSKMEHQEQIARKEQSEYEKQQERYRKIMQKVEHQQNTITRQNPHGGQLLKKKMHAVKSMGRRMEREHEQMTEIPDTEDAIMVQWTSKTDLPAGKNILDFELDCLAACDEKVLARDLTLHIRGPEKICIIGKNGVGKTTLIRMIAHELLKRRDLHTVYMPQNYEELMDFDQTPVEFLDKTGDRENINKVRTFLGSMKYTADEMAHKIADLSGGQKAKLFFLKMLLDGADVLVLDEPTRNFSPLSGPVIRRILGDFRGCIISISHDRKYIEEVCDVIYELTCDGLKRLP